MLSNTPRHWLPLTKSPSPASSPPVNTSQNSFAFAFPLAFALACSTIVYAQSYPAREIDPERLVNEIFPQQNLDLNYPELYETLLLRLANPLDLNQATAEELRALYILREPQLHDLLAWRKTYGALLSVYELQAIPSFDLPMLVRLMPFVRVRDPAATLDKKFMKRVAAEGESYIITRWGRTLEPRKGERKTTAAASRYAGTPDQLYLRFRISKPGDFSMGFTAEKDAGEKVRFDPAKKYYGPDFVSFHAQATGKGNLQNLVAGDFAAQFGQGLVLGGGFGMGKGSETITTLRRSNLGFSPYSSVGEAGFFRGVAATVSVTPHLTFSSFLSRIRKDAVEQSDSADTEFSFVSSFAVSGLHRTPRELDTRRKIVEVNTGGALSYKNKSLETGIVLQHTRFSLPITRKPTVYNQFSFNGDRVINTSVFLNYSIHNVAFFGEAAGTWHAGTAIVAGFLGSVTRKLDLAVLFRNYAMNYYSFYSNALAENTVPQNESGLYWGWKYVWSKKYSASGYADLFRFPWLRYRAYAPGEGSEWLLRFNYQPAKTILLYAQLREESKIRNLPAATTLYQAASGIKHSVWINADYAADLNLKFKTRAQFSRYALAGKVTRGMVLLQDVSLDAGPFSFSARYAIFHTDDYDNRQYVYERDVWLAFSFPAYYGTGIHTYALVQYKVSKGVDFWFRWSHTRYTDRNTIGSGSDEIDQNVRNDLKLQARIRFF